MLVPTSVWSCVHIMCGLCTCVCNNVRVCVCGEGGVGECVLCAFSVCACNMYVCMCV